MASLKTKFTGFTDQCVNDLAVHTMTTYYRPEEKNASPNTGFCIPVEPETRLTDSPTGGVIGRYLAKPIDCGSPSRTTSTAISSVNSSPAIVTNMDHTPGPALQQRKLGRQKAVVEFEQQGQVGTHFLDGSHGMYQVSPDLRKWPIFTWVRLTWPQQIGEAPYTRSGNAHHTLAATGAYDCYSVNSTSNYPDVQKQPASASSMSSAASQKQLNMENMEFLMKTLDEQVNASTNVSPMTLLVPVHQDRPGQHILRIDERTGVLYACIPGNPFAPKDNGNQQNYNLPTYDSYIQKTARGGRQEQNPYPAVGLSSLNTCNHCGVPTKVLNNDSLCPFHAYYLATGQFLGYYEFCALVEMEKQGLSITSGWRTVEEMVHFVGALTKRIQMWLFIEDSSAIPEGSWVGKVSPYGAIGGPVPSRAQGKTAYRVGTEQKMAEAVGRHASPVVMEKTEFQLRAEQTLAMVMGRQTDLSTMDSAANQLSGLNHVCNGTAGAICV